MRKYSQFRNRRYKTLTHTANATPVVPLPEKPNANPTPVVLPTKDSGVSEITNDSKTQTHDVVMSDDDRTEVDSQDLLLRNRQEIEPVIAPVRPLWIWSPPRDRTETVDVQVQTDVLLPSEETSSALLALRQVEILKGMLRVRGWSIDRGKWHRLGVTDLLLMEEPVMNEIKLEQLTPVIASEFLSEPAPGGMEGIEVIDLVSESQTNAVPQDSVQIYPASHAYGGESLRYSLLHPCPDEPAAGAFRTVLKYVEDQVLSNVRFTSENWSGSFIESAVDTLLLTADMEGSLSCQLLADFCQQLIEVIASKDHFNEGDICEHYSNIVLKLCESIAIAIRVIEVLLRKLIEVQDIIDETGFAAKEQIYILENSFHVLKILYSILLRIEERAKGSVAEVIRSLSITRNAHSGVLNAWRRHWRPMDENPIPMQLTHSTKVGIWLEKLESVLRSAYLRAPLVATFVVKCVEIVKKLEQDG